MTPNQVESSQRLRDHNESHAKQDNRPQKPITNAFTRDGRDQSTEDPDEQENCHWLVLSGSGTGMGSPRAAAARSVAPSL